MIKYNQKETNNRISEREERVMTDREKMITVIQSRIEDEEMGTAYGLSDDDIRDIIIEELEFTFNLEYEELTTALEDLTAYFLSE
jgi:hypothetical protein